MTATSPYRGRVIAFGTKHGKERLAATAFHQHLRARVVATTGLDTDLLGTFSGERPRTLSPVDAARVKARLGMHIAGTPFGLASEGTFSAAGAPGVVEDGELLLFVDEETGIEVVETSRAISPIPGPTVVGGVGDVLGYAARIGFPRQGIVVTATAAEESGTRWLKDLGSRRELEQAVESLLASTPGGELRVQPDYRAHACPSRAAHLRSLAERMARRLATTCPECGSPGWGELDSEAGLPCRDCGRPTSLESARVSGCARCSHRERTQAARRDADPEWCDYCNP